MSNSDTISDFELILALTSHLGSSGIQRVLARNAVTGRSPEYFLSLSAEVLQEEYALKPQAARALTEQLPKLKSQVEGLKRRFEGKDVRLVTIQSPLYPKTLEAFCESPPAYLFMYGNISVLSTKTFCVLASRDADRSTADLLEKQVELGVLEPKTLVTGANTPAYMRAAVVPLRWGAPRILVLDRGLFVALGENLDQEPFPAARLWRYKFDPLTDLVISSFRPDDPFIGHNNKLRDEIVVALADQVVAVRPRPGGVMEQLSDRAERLGKDVTWIR